MVRNHKGLFITFEKTKEGLGGTTQAQRLYNNLKEAGIDVILTKEPGGTRLGQEIRQMLLNPNHKLSKATELFLFLADRAQHYKEVLKPALKDGKIVICDRYFDSTLAYQGAGRGWKNALLWRLHHATTGSLLPDVTIVLNGTPYRERSTEDRMEKLDDKFHSRVESAMLHLSSKSDRYHVLDANQDEDKLATEIVELVKHKLASQELPKS